VLVLVIMRVAVIVLVIVTAARSVNMAVIVRMVVGIRMVVRMRVLVMRVVIMIVLSMSVIVMLVAMMLVVMVPMIVMPMIVMAVVVPAIVLVGAAFRLEGAHHQGRRAALPAHHFGEDVILLDVDRVRRDLGRAVTVAHMIGDLQQPERILGLDFEEPLRRRLHLDEPPVLQLHGVPVPEDRGLVEVEQEFQSVVAGQGDPAAMAALMVEGHGIGDAVGLDGRLADDCGRAQHDLSSKQEVALRHG
jgi:hypothetical protein